MDRKTLTLNLIDGKLEPTRDTIRDGDVVLVALLVRDDKAMVGDAVMVAIPIPAGNPREIAVRRDAIVGILPRAPEAEDRVTWTGEHRVRPDCVGVVHATKAGKAWVYWLHGASSGTHEVVDIAHIERCG